MQKPVIILGIDPGTLLMGYSVIEAYKNSFSIKTIDVLKLSSKKDHYQRLQMIHQKIMELVEEFSPNEFAIEAPFFGKNVQSMLKLGRAQGVAIAAAMTKNIPVTEYSPRKIKQSITGNGNADKEQVWKMLQRITALPDKPKHYDATDALAVAICHYFGTKNLSEKKSTGTKKSSGWEKFIQQNPERILKMR
ncbi:MAG: crossover junction endodeoxyribonuclease RuvC [Flavisolibacter sp.]|nr:crossover junction endodeoxyribonuclease RuvC [Flavisolibacter sp.]